MNRTERAMEAVSQAVREATWAFEREILEVKVDDLPTPVIEKAVGGHRCSAHVAPRALRTCGVRYPLSPIPVTLWGDE